MPETTARPSSIRSLGPLAALLTLVFMLPACGGAKNQPPRPEAPPPRESGVACDAASGRCYRVSASGWTEKGLGVWYGGRFHGRRTASGERFDQNRFTAAHKTLPFGALVEVTNPANQKRVVVRINDRGPFMPGAVIDLSRGAARSIGLSGAIPVSLKRVEPAE